MCLFTHDTKHVLQRSHYRRHRKEQAAINVSASVSLKILPLPRHEDVKHGVTKIELSFQKEYAEYSPTLSTTYWYAIKHTTEALKVAQIMRGRFKEQHTAVKRYATYDVYPKIAAAAHKIRDTFFYSWTHHTSPRALSHPATSALLPPPLCASRSSSSPSPSGGTPSPSPSSSEADASLLGASLLVTPLLFFI